MGKKSKWKYRKINPEIARALYERGVSIAKKDIWAGLISAIVCFIFCLVLSIEGQSDARIGMLSLGWNVTHGEVTKTYVVCNKHINSSRSRRGRPQDPVLPARRW